MITKPEQTTQLLPVTIVTGFLGSGKTTLLNHILSNQQGIRTAVLVNEFGKIGIDQDLIVDQHDGIVELSNGCICCTTNHDLIEAVAKILQRRNEIDYLIVETTGVADPYSIAMTFVGRDLSPYVRLDSIITLVDAENFNDELLQNAAAYNQLKYGDIILLNKSSLAAKDKLSHIASEINKIKQHSRIITCNYSRVNLSLLLDIDAFDESTLSGNERQHDHSKEYQSFSFEFDQPFDKYKLQDFLGNKLPRTTYRAKGILWIADIEKRNVFHLTGRRFTIDQTDWRDQQRKNQIVIIGKSLDKLKLEKQLKACLSNSSS